MFVKYLRSFIIILKRRSKYEIPAAVILLLHILKRKHSLSTVEYSSKGFAHLVRLRQVSINDGVK
jgi:hypothetical protein